MVLIFISHSCFIDLTPDAQMMHVKLQFHLGGSYWPFLILPLDLVWERVKILRVLLTRNGIYVSSSGFKVLCWIQLQWEFGTCSLHDPQALRLGPLVVTCARSSSLFWGRSRIIPKEEISTQLKRGYDMGGLGEHISGKGVRSLGHARCGLWRTAYWHWPWIHFETSTTFGLWPDRHPKELT